MYYNFFTYVMLRKLPHDITDLPILFVSVPKRLGMGGYRISEVGVGFPILDDGKARFEIEALHNGNG